jgi:hypothetical protein
MLFNATFNNVSVISWRWDVTSVKSNFSSSRWVSYYFSRNVISKITSLGLWLVKRDFRWTVMIPLSATHICVSLNVCKYTTPEIPEVICNRITFMDYLHKAPLIWVMSWGVILWLGYICKTCHINAKYAINCYNSYDYIAYYCFDSHQMFVNCKRQVKIISSTFFIPSKLESRKLSKNLPM